MTGPQTTLTLEDGFALRDLLANSDLEPLAAVVSAWLKRVSGGKAPWPQPVQDALAAGTSFGDQIRRMLASLDAQFPSQMSDGDAEAVDREIRHRLGELIEFLSSAPTPATIATPVRRATEGNTIGSDRKIPTQETRAGGGADFEAPVLLTPTFEQEVRRGFGGMFGLERSEQRPAGFVTKKRDIIDDLRQSGGTSPKEGDHEVHDDWKEKVLRSKAEDLAGFDWSAKELRQAGDKFNAASAIVSARTTGREGRSSVNVPTDDAASVVSGTESGLVELKQDEKQAIEKLIQRPYSLVAEEWRKVKLAATRNEKLRRSVESPIRFREACRAIDELQAETEVTPERLTQLFAEKHKAAKTHLGLTDGEVLEDPQKERFVELVNAFQALGGKVKLKGDFCNVDLVKPDSMTQHQFRVRTANKKKAPLWKEVKIPSLVFVKN